MGQVARCVYFIDRKCVIRQNISPRLTAHLSKNILLEKVGTTFYKPKFEMVGYKRIQKIKRFAY
jgi:hypothetical protein